MDAIQQLQDFRKRRTIKESALLVGDADHKIQRMDSIEQFYYFRAMDVIEDIGQRIYPENAVLTAGKLLIKLRQNTSS